MKFNNPTFFKWFKSILLVVVAILLLCSILCGYMLVLLRNNTIQMSSNLTQYIQTNIDSRLFELYKYSSSLELHPANIYLKKLKTAPKTIPPKVYQLSDQMLNYNYSNKLIDSIFIYYPNLHKIVGNLGCYDADSYYALDNLLLLNGYEQWLDTLTMESDSDFAYLQSDSRNQFCYIRKIKNSEELVGYLVFELNADELLNSSLMTENSEDPHSSLGILLDGQLIAYTGNSEELTRLAALMPDTLETPVVLEESASLLYARPSSLKNLCYLNVYFHKKNLQPVYITLGICILGILVCGISGILASVLISRKNIRPLINLLDKIGGTPDKENDEYETIHKRFDQLIKDYWSNTEKVQEQQSLINNFFLKTVLYGDMHSEYAIFNVAKRCNILFENPRYLIAIAEPVSARPQLDEDLLLTINKYWETHHFDVISSFHEGNIVILFNIEETISQNTISKLIKEMKADVFGEDKWVIALGLDYDGLVNIQYSYAQAVTALHYQIKPESSVICYNIYMENISSPGLSYIDTFENFSKNMIQNDYSAALVLLPAVFGNYFSEEDSSEITKVKFRAIQNLLLNAKQKVKQEIQNSGCSIHTAQILSCTSPAQLREYTQCILKELSTPSQGTKNGTSSIAERAKTIILRDFSDPMLGLYRISAELNISDSYLSTTFKSAFGIGVVQYINSLRIEQAKKLICDTDLSIREIALAVGFSSDASFIRVFKRYELQTPNTLRKNQR